MGWREYQLMSNSWPPLFNFNPLTLSLSQPLPPPEPPLPQLLITLSHILFSLPLRPIAQPSSFPKLLHHHHSLHSSFAKLTATNPTSPLPQPNLFLQHQPFCPPCLPMALFLHHKTLSLIPYLICFASQLATAMPSS